MGNNKVSTFFEDNLLKSDFINLIQSPIRCANANADLQDNLLRIHRETLDLRESRAAQQLTLGIHRSDYMLDEPSNTLMQVCCSRQLDLLSCTLAPFTATLLRFRRFFRTFPLLWSDQSQHQVKCNIHAEHDEPNAPAAA